MLGLVIAVIPDLVAVDDTADVAGIDLHTSLQTKHSVQQWHILINQFQKVKVYARLWTETDALKQTMGLLKKNCIVAGTN